MLCAAGCLLTFVSLAAAASTQPPALPFYDWKACPGEGCTYGEWQVSRPLVVYDTLKPGRQEIARLVKGERVAALSGVVITYKPGLVRVDRDVPEQKLKRGETILTYAYRGEGFSAIWLKGSYYPDFDISITRWPDGTGCGNEHCAATYLDLGKKAWWAKIRLKSGKVGWVNMTVAGLLL